MELISTGGTYRKLQEEEIEATEISDITGFPECLDGRVKTLHPLFTRACWPCAPNPEHMKQLQELHIEPLIW